jgi:hypothetical protein
VFLLASIAAEFFNCAAGRKQARAIERFKCI